jgi:hypothetical protein
MEFLSESGFTGFVDLLNVCLSDDTKVNYSSDQFIAIKINISIFTLDFYKKFVLY